jgi:multimeric flavodoxin WrbA
MKIIAIISSPRGKNSNTLKLVNAALDGVSAAGAEAEIVDVAKLKIKYCNSMQRMSYDRSMPHQRYYNEVLEKKLLSADGIIWSSPNYMTNVNCAA